MTAPARQPAPDVTDSGHERMSERAPETARVLPIRPDLARESRAHARYHGPRSSGKTNKPSKVRDFVSLHAGEAKTALRTSETAAYAPRSLAELADTITTAKRDSRNIGHFAALLIARLNRLAVHALAYLACHATDTDKRSAVTLALTALVFTIATFVGLLAA